jgi:hypothetical protein
LTKPRRQLCKTSNTWQYTFISFERYYRKWLEVRQFVLGVFGVKKFRGRVRVSVGVGRVRGKAAIPLTTAKALENCRTCSLCRQKRLLSTNQTIGGIYGTFCFPGGYI